MKKNETEITKVALVTGAARRIGAEIAQILHAAGMNIVLHFHTSTAEAEALCDLLNGKRANSVALLPADLLEMDKFDSILSQAVSIWGRLDALVNNASRFYRTPIGEVTSVAWDDLLQANVKAPFFLAQAAQTYLSASQGSIVNIIDIHAERPLKDYSAYCIAKAGLIMATKSLAKELAPAIRVNAVSPTVMIWPEGENALAADVKQKIIDKTVLGRLGHPSDIAKAVRYLILDADYVTGQVLAVDGGRSLLT